MSQSDGVTIVTGASGMLGGAIYRRLLADKVPVEGWSRATDLAPDGTTFTRGVASFTDSIRNADLVIHCAALTDADYCEANPGEANFVNVLWSKSLAQEAALTGARFIYVSTDAVYDGDVPGRLSREDDPPRPLSVYARTKLAGEQAVLQAYAEATVVRTTMFGWTLPGKREKLAEQILRALVLKQPIKLWGDAIFSPLHVVSLAEDLLCLAELQYPGVLNIGARDPTSKADFGRLIAWEFGFDPSAIEETSVDDADLPAKRTKSTALDVTLARGLLGTLGTTRAGISRLRQELGDGTVERLKGGSWPTSST